MLEEWHPLEFRIQPCYRESIFLSEKMPIYLEKHDLLLKRMLFHAIPLKKIQILKKKIFQFFGNPGVVGCGLKGGDLVGSR